MHGRQRHRVRLRVRDRRRSTHTQSQTRPGITTHVARVPYRHRVGVAFPEGGGSFPGGSGFTFLRESRQWATFTASSPFLCVSQSHFYRFSFYRNHTVELARAVGCVGHTSVEKVDLT